MFFLTVLLNLCILQCGDYIDTPLDYNAPVCIRSRRVKPSLRRPLCTKVTPVGLLAAGTLILGLVFGLTELKGLGPPELAHASKTGPFSVMLCAIGMAGPIMVVKETLEDLARGKGCGGRIQRVRLEAEEIEEGRAKRKSKTSDEDVNSKAREITQEAMKASKKARAEQQGDKVSEEGQDSDSDLERDNGNVGEDNDTSEEAQVDRCTNNVLQIADNCVDEDTEF